MEHFTFNDIKSETLGILVKEMPLVPRAQRNIESVNINGRNGALHIDNKNYLPKNYTIKCIAKNKEYIDKICSTYVGTHKLTLSKYPNRYWNATIKNQIDFSTYLTYLNEFPLQFELDPVAYSSEEKIVSLNSTKTININGTAEIFPILIINGTGNVIINGYPVTILESGITIDCDLMQCYLGIVSKNDMVELLEFPKLTPGLNEIVLGDGIENIDIRYREGWL